MALIAGGTPPDISSMLLAIAGETPDIPSIMLVIAGGTPPDISNMLVAIKKDKEKIHWTKHSKEKRRFYQLSEKRLLRVLHYPDRKEKGIAPETIAVMQRAGSKKHPYEIWLMRQTVKIKNRSKIKIISAWKYPGISPIGEPIPIPEDILKELSQIIR